MPGLDDERHAAGRLLRDRTIDPLLRHRLREIDAVDRADDADDADLRAVGPPRWISWPMALRPLKYLSTRYRSTIGDLRAVRGVAVVEDATFDERDLHRAEVVRADDLLPRVRPRFARRPACSRRSSTNRS